MKTVLFACVHNAGRSQIAAAWFNALSAQAISAGTRPTNQVHREVITAMKEVGIDLSSARPQVLTEELARVQTCWSRWAAVRPALSFQEPNGRTGLSPIPRDNRWKRFARFAMRFNGESQRCSPKEVGDENNTAQ